MLANTLLFIGNLGTGEIILLVLLVVMLFGAKKIPELARGMGKGIREFKDATKEIKNDIENAANDDRPVNRNNPGYNNSPNNSGYTNNNNNGYNIPNNGPYNNDPVTNPNPTVPQNPNI